MVTICCTERLAKRFDLRLGIASKASASNVLGDWYATLLNAGPLRLVVFVNQPSNLTVVTPARKADFPSRFPTALESLLMRIGIPPFLALREREASSEFSFVKTNDRSMLGSLRDAAVRIRWDVERGLDIAAAEDQMSEMPSRAKAFIFPREVVFSRFGMEGSSTLPPVRLTEG